MNKKAQMEVMGTIIMVAITLIVGVILFQAVAQEAGKSSATGITLNQTITGPAVGTYVDLNGQELLATIGVTNGTSGVAIPANNYTIGEGVSLTTGVKTVWITLTTGSPQVGRPINVSYEYGVEGYVDSAGARSMISLIAIFFALAIAVVALTPTLRGGLLEMIGR